MHPKYKRWCDEYFYSSTERSRAASAASFFDDLADGFRPLLRLTQKSAIAFSTLMRPS